VDSSALIAILLSEDERATALDALFDAERRLMSAFSLVEASIVVTARKGIAGKSLLDGLLQDAGIEIVALDREQAEIARDAWYDFGRGRHAAALNIGDCCSYALARASDLPLLFKGDDFPHTDLDAVRL